MGIDDNGKYLCRAQNSEGFGQESLPIYIETKGLILSFFFIPIFMNNKFQRQLNFI